MNRLADALHAIAVTVWAGTLWAIGLLAVPALFRTLGDRALAAQLAAHLIEYAGFIGLACAAYLLLFRIVRFRASVLRQAFFWVVIAMVLLVLVSQFWWHAILDSLRGQLWAHRLAEEVFRDRSAAWHGVASAFYLVQCAFAVLLVVLQQDAPH